WKAQCILAHFPITQTPSSFHHDPEAEDYFFQLYKYYAIVEKNWIKREFSTQILFCHKKSITCLAGSDSGDTIYTGSADKTVKLWDLNTHSLLKEFRDHTEGVQSLALGPTIFVSGGWDKTIFVYDLTKEHAQKYRLLGHT